MIGRGGMGQIFKVVVKHKPDLGTLALKVIDSPNLSRIDRLRFEREFQLASRFEHPNLVQVYEFGSHRGTTYFTMEWVKGTDIDSAYEQELKDEGADRLPKVAIKWIEDVLIGLETLHEAGIVHRDLKPDNILIDLQGRAKLLDLGLASHFTEEESNSRLTTPGAVLGTVNFMAPEQVIGADVNSRSDLYSLGVILYRWFSGRLPFSAPDPISTIGKILHEPVPPLEPRFKLPKAAVELVERLLAKEPDDRPISAAQVRGLWCAAFGSISESAEIELVSASLDSLPLPPRFVGRELVMQRAQSCLTEDHTQGLKLVFTGAAGMGKSRCLNELRDWAKRRRWKVLSSVSSPLDTLPFQPLLEPLRASLKFGIPPTLESFRSDLALILPELAPDDSEDLDTELNPLRRYRLFEGMRRVLVYDRRATDEAVTLLTLEELQHTGDETLEFLHFLKQRQEMKGGNRLLVTGTLSASFEDRDSGSDRLQETLRSETLRTLDLQPLEADCARRLILSMVGGGEIETVSLQAFVSQSEGNPLFLIEMTRVFLEEGRLHRIHRGDTELWKLRLHNVSETSTGTSRIPDSLKTVISRRLRPLDPEDRDLLKKAAFLGLRFSFPLLAALQKRTEADVLDSLVRLSHQGLVKEGRGTETFDFCNSVIPAVLLDSASKTEKRQTHLQICEEAIARNPEGSDPFWLAWHYREAGEEELALRHLLASAELALQSYSFAQAAALYREVLSGGVAFHKLGFKRSELEEREADALRYRGELEQASATYASLLEQETDLTRAHRVRLERKLAQILDAQGHPSQALERLKKAWEGLGLQALENLKGRWKLATLLKALTLSEFRLTSNSRIGTLLPEEAAEVAALAIQLQRALFFVRPTNWVRQGVEIALVQRQVNKSTQDCPLASAQADFNGGYLCLRLPKGWQAQSLRLLHRAVEKAQSAPASFARLDLLRDCGYLLHLAGRSEIGLQLLTETAETAEEIGHLTCLPLTYGLAAAAAQSTGQFERAEADAWKGYHLAIALENQKDLVLTRLQLVRILASLDKPEESQAMLDACSEAEFQQFPYLEVLRTQARIQLTLQSGDRAKISACSELTDKGLKLCVDMDELLYTRNTFRLLQSECLLAGTEASTITMAHWDTLEKQLRPFPHLRFRGKLLKVKWLATQDDKKRTLKSAKALLQRQECHSGYRRQINALIQTVTSS